jgi:manganese catalase
LHALPFEHGRGPWNEGEQWECVEAPAFHEVRETVTDSPPIHAESSEPTEVELIEELLVDQLRDILHAEKQVLKALPKIVKAAHSAQLQQLFEMHLKETEAQIERLNECLGLLDVQPRAKACKGMMGIVEEGDEVMAEGKKKDETAADLALIGAAQKVEHYEMSGYITARNLAQQLHMAPVVRLLQTSLAEEENTDQLLNQAARPLMSVAKISESIE